MADTEHNPTDHMLGSVDASIAAEWGNVEDPGTLDMTGEAAKINGLSQEAARIALERGGVVAVTEDGVPTGKVVGFGDKILGDNVKSLDTSKGEDKKSDTNPELTNDPKELLSSGTLSYLTETKPEDTADPEKHNLLKKEAEKKVLGPEQAVLLSQETTKKLANETVDEVSHIVRLLTNLEEEGKIDRGLTELDNMLPEARRTVSELINALDSGQPMDEYHLALTGRLSEFAMDYARVSRTTKQTTEESSQSARRLPGSVEELTTALRSGKFRIENELGSASLGNIEPGLLEPTIQRVIQRGANSLAEHQQQCAEEGDVQLKIVGEASNNAATLEVQVEDLAASLKLRDDYASEELPSHGNIENMAEELRRQVSSSIYSDGNYSAMISETLGSLHNYLMRAEQGAVNLRGIDSKATAQLTASIQAAQALKRSNLFEAA